MRPTTESKENRPAQLQRVLVEFERDPNFVQNNPCVDAREVFICRLMVLCLGGLQHFLLGVGIGKCEITATSESSNAWDVEGLKDLVDVHLAARTFVL